MFSTIVYTREVENMNFWKQDPKGSLIFCYFEAKVSFFLPSWFGELTVTLKLCSSFYFTNNSKTKLHIRNLPHSHLYFQAAPTGNRNAGTSARSALRAKTASPDTENQHLCAKAGNCLVSKNDQCIVPTVLSCLTVPVVYLEEHVTNGMKHDSV